MKKISHRTLLDEMPVATLKGVGPRIGQRLERLGIGTVQDLLLHLPLRYEDRTRVLPMRGLRSGDRALVEGTVESSEIHHGRRRALLVCLGDGTATLTLRFFHFSAAQRVRWETGRRLRCFGEVRNGLRGLEMIHPESEDVDAHQRSPGEEALTPVYPTTEGLQQTSLRALTAQALQLLADAPESLPEWLPAGIREQYGFPELAEALRLLHRPPRDQAPPAIAEAPHPACRRLVFEELLAHQLGLRRVRFRQRRGNARPLRGADRLRSTFLRRLPFRLTGAQERVAAEIASDLSRSRPMLRLVQGDVGSGKTVVAALAALQAVEAGFQVALMAPTELLSEQHQRNFRHWISALAVPVLWLTGRHRGRDRATVVAAIGAGDAAVVVGTHALFQHDVVFHALGLVIVDEQHRFGVHQRLALREKGSRDGCLPHQLVMTATPIPRSLAMAAYADLDLSVIDELPPGRTPVTTAVVPDTRRDQVMARVREACAAGCQAYWVCTLITESEVLQCQAAENTAAELCERLSGLRVGLVHGRMPAADKERIMEGFKQGELDLLVATTVVEVGVDVPNASLMVIENPERLGLAQLHQLRGRVGRGARASHCLLLYHPPLSAAAQQRMGILRESRDGFEIARRDLELRGPGEVLGTRQTGEMQFRVADLVRDRALLPEVQRVADLMLRGYAEQAQGIEQRWLGSRRDYGRV